ncbi:Hypothetical_protein [Hexamita inflata]|uniref:Hypothetical_protein n=1 Tax=Hexamita inflata TaxID=28002 RepID=A0AA86N894_9EUKA|nr:Hypothetical protein HINF_LOCUS2532 [Hexamita inflata]
MINGNCVQVNCSVSGQISINGICQCQPGFTTISGSCQNIEYSLQNLDSSVMCTQTLYITSFDFQMVTNNITSPLNFSLGYVFSSNIQDSFIDLQDNVYTSTIKPLFQTQISFINIKIQIGTQKVTGGSLMTNSNQITINQLNIVSKQGTQITVTSGQFNILQASANSANIQGLFIKLNFAMSAGNITLLGFVSGNLSIKGYQIQGDYQTSTSMAMISLTLNSTDVKIYNLNFMPNSYNVGLQSSYLMNTVLSCSIQLMNISTIIGSIDQFSILTLISSTTSKLFIFGGLITNQTNTITTVDRYISDCYQLINTNYSKNSGIIIGYAFQNLNQISIQNMCLLQNVQGTSLKLSYFGLIGTSQGSITLTNSAIQFNVQSAALEQFGILGSQEILNIEITNTISTGIFTASITGRKIGGVIGQSTSLNCTIFNSTVIHNNISNNNNDSNLGSVVGFQDTLSSFCFIQSTVKNCIISTGGWSAVLIGYQDSNASTFVHMSSISESSVYGTRSNSIIIGYIYCDSIVKVQNTNIQNCNATTTDQSVAVIVGCAYQSQSISLIDSKLTNIRLYINTAKLSYAKFVIGENMGRIIINEMNNINEKFLIIRRQLHK